MLVEGPLQRMELPVAGHGLDGRHLPPVRLDREQRARLHGPPVEEHGAGSAGRGVASDVRPGEAQRLSQVVDEQLSRLHVVLVTRAIDGDGDLSHRPSFQHVPVRERRQCMSAAQPGARAPPDRRSNTHRRCGMVMSGGPTEEER